jgi:serine/threonine-protein kinase TTK/MPS1
MQFDLLDPSRVFMVNGTPYLTLQKIGKGGSSKVYKVLAPDTSVYALKRVDISNHQPHAIECFGNEIKLLRMFRGSERIIGFIDSEVDEESRTISIVLELGDIDLRSLIEKNRSENEDVDPHFLRLMWQQMLEATQIAHNAKVIHGDLKPANFLFVRGTLKLIDFGIAKSIRNDTTNIERTNQVGTLNYMSPEALKMNEERQRFKVGRAADVWSLGCILYQLVYNRPPFPQTDWLHKIQAIVDDRYEIDFPAIPGRPDLDDLVDVVRRCLRRDPKQRPRIGELLQHRYLTFGSIDFRRVEAQLLSFVLMVQDRWADSDFDDPGAAGVLEAIAEQFRSGETIGFPE